MKYGEAHELAKQGKKIKRESWVDQYVFYQEGYTIEPSEARNPIMAAMSGPLFIRPHFNMKTVNDCIIVGWSPTTKEMYEIDWIEYE